MNLSEANRMIEKQERANIMKILVNALIVMGNRVRLFKWQKYLNANKMQ